MGDKQSVKRYRHVVWDWNGTLMDDLMLCLDIINKILQRRDLHEVDLERYRAVFGFPLPDYCRRLGFDLRRDPFEILNAEFGELYEARRCESPLQKGVEQVLSSLLVKGVQHTLLSAYEEEKLREIVAFYGLSAYFEAILGMDNDRGEGKVERGRRCMEERGWQAEEMVYIGDTLHDAEVAEAMGIDCVLVAHGHQNRERLASSGWPVVADLHQIHALVGWENSVQS